MKIFMSHATANQEIVLEFSRFLERVSSDIEVYCTLDKGRIKIGKDFVEEIFKNLNDSDLFIPVISQEYYKSKFCMIELGVAYSFLYDKYKIKGEEYIFPFALHPITKEQALSGTPMSKLQVGEINSKEDIKSFLDYLLDEKMVDIKSCTNEKIHSFTNTVDYMLLKKQDILKMARIKTYCDSNISFRAEEDIINHTFGGDEIVVNFNLNPYEVEEVRYPNYIGMALRFTDKINLSRYLDFNDDAQFQFKLFSFTNSLKQIFVEFKYADNHDILESVKIPLVAGENNLKVPLKNMRSKALENISEICFVLHPNDIVEDEGMFKVSEINII